METIYAAVCYILFLYGVFFFKLLGETCEGFKMAQKGRPQAECFLSGDLLGILKKSCFFKNGMLKVIWRVSGKEKFMWGTDILKLLYKTKKMLSGHAIRKVHPVV